MAEKKASLIENIDPGSPDRLTEERPWEDLFLLKRLWKIIMNTGCIRINR